MRPGVGGTHAGTCRHTCADGTDINLRRCGCLHCHAAGLAVQHGTITHFGGNPGTVDTQRRDGGTCGKQTTRRTNRIYAEQTGTIGRQTDAVGRQTAACRHVDTHSAVAQTGTDNQTSCHGAQSGTIGLHRESQGIFCSRAESIAVLLVTTQIDADGVVHIGNRYSRTNTGSKSRSAGVTLDLDCRLAVKGLALGRRRQRSGTYGRIDLGTHPGIGQGIGHRSAHCRAA